VLYSTLVVPYLGNTVAVLLFKANVDIANILPPASSQVKLMNNGYFWFTHEHSLYKAHLNIYSSALKVFRCLVMLY
jgi:hypothetical protein